MKQFDKNMWSCTVLINGVQNRILFQVDTYAQALLIKRALGAISMGRVL